MGNKVQNELIPVEISEEMLKSKIYVIRGQRVMLDSDLAEIYGYTTSRFNEQVSNNIEKFEDEDFSFYLTKAEFMELNNLISKKSISSWGGRRKPPRAFTESGVYMLMTVLKGELAVRQSKALIRTFKQMKDYISEDPLLPGAADIARLSIQIAENTKDISELKEKMITKDDLMKVVQSFSLPDKGIEYVIYAGQTFEADVAYADIYSKAKKKLYIVDNYIGPKTLLMLKSVPDNVEIIIFSDNSKNILRLSELRAFQVEYPNIRLSFQKTGGKFHDRYIILDYKSRSEKIYHCGASSKDAGNKITTISKADNIELYHPMIENLLLRPELKLK